MTRIVGDLEGFKSREPNKAIIPSLRLFTIGRREFIDLLSKNRGDLVSSMHCTHLINKRSFEVFEEKIDSRFTALEAEEFDAVVMEITVDRKSRLNKFYWIKCTPDLERGIDLNRMMTLAACMKQGRSIEQARLLSEQTHYQKSLEGTGLKHTLLVTVSSKPEDFESNLNSLTFFGSDNSEQQTSTKRHRHDHDDGVVRFTHTERFFGEEKERPEIQNNLESRLSKLVNTYKSAGFDDEDESAEPLHEEPVKSLRLEDQDRVASLKMLRTKRKLQAIEKRIEEDQQATRPNSEFRPLDTSPLETPLQ
jgi:hypothetical protein